MKHIAHIGIGSNVGDKVRNCREAISRILRLDDHELIAQSSLYKTEPVGFTSQDWFVNGVIKIQTSFGPSDLLQELMTLEFRMGREKTFRWGPRKIDLDLLFYDEVESHEEGLDLPHPRLHERRFVLAPLAEIDPEHIHPGLRKRVKDLLEDLGSGQGVEKLNHSS